MDSRLFSILILVILCKLTFAQKFEWATQLGTTGGEYAWDITEDNTGNIYLCGVFTNTIDVDPGPGFHYLVSSGAEDVFVCKYAPNGNFIWAKQMGGLGAEGASSIRLDKYGNIYISGVMGAPGDYDPGTGVHTLNSIGSKDIFVCKLNTAGNFKWAHVIGGTLSEEVYHMDIDTLGNIYLAGFFNGSVDFDPGPGISILTSPTADNGFICKLDSNGNYSWASGLLGTGTSATEMTKAFGVTYTKTGDIFVTGTFWGSLTVGLTTITGGGAYVAKFNVSGNLIWLKKFGEFGHGTRGDAVTGDQFGNVYVTGRFTSARDFDPGVDTFNLSSGGQDVYICKLNPSGDFVWAKSFAGQNSPFYNGVQAIASDNSSYIYVSGDFTEKVDFDPGPNTFILETYFQGASQDVFISKLDYAGNLEYAKAFTGPGLSESTALSVDNSGEVLITGFFHQNFDINPQPPVFNLTSAGGQDIFICKLSFCQQDVVVDVVNNCGPYTWIDGNLYQNNDSTALFTFLNSNGCDSILKLDLTIKKPEVGVEVVAACDSFIWTNGKTYYYPNSEDKDTIQNAMGCDSIVVLNLTLTKLDAKINLSGNEYSYSKIDPSLDYQWLECDHDYTPIVGATERIFKATTPGSYAVRISKNNCADTSDCLFFSSIHQLSNISNNLVIRPNPATTKLYIDRLPVQPGTIFLYNSQGLLVLSEHTTGVPSISIDLPDNLANGVYLIRYESNGISGSEQFVVKH